MKTTEIVGVWIKTEVDLVQSLQTLGTLFEARRDLPCLWRVAHCASLIIGTVTGTVRLHAYLAVEAELSSIAN